MTSWSAHDRDQPWGADPGGIAAGRCCSPPGQPLEPIPDELACAASKGALQVIKSEGGLRRYG
jgi:hypothetical protein